MPSFHIISYYLFATLAAVSFTSAIPAPLPQVAAIAPDLHTRCGGCEANPLPVIIRDVQDRITPLADKLRHLPADGCTSGTVGPIVKEMKDIIIDASAKVQAHLDASVDVGVGINLGTLLGGSANGGIDIDISVEAFAGTLAGLVNVVVPACVSILRLGGSVDLEVMKNILADLCVTLSTFIQLCGKVVVGLSASLTVQIGAFLALCTQLGIKLSIASILGIVF